MACTCVPLDILCAMSDTCKVAMELWEDYFSQKNITSISCINIVW